MKSYQPVIKPKLSNGYLVPSVIAVGIIPLIVHEHTYNTHLENEDWFAVGNSSATDFFLFYKQWAVITLAVVCLIILLTRAKYYFEDLPWEKKPFMPLLIYGAFVILSACFAKKHLFAFAGGYDMFQSALAILSYMVLFYYTYSCIQTEEHVRFLLRWSEYFMLAEILICFLQAVGFNVFNTTVGKILITDPSRWKNLDSVSMETSVYGTLYNPDYLATYLPFAIPLSIGLLIVEKKIVRKILNAVLLALSLFVLVKASSAAMIGVVGAAVLGVLILSSRKWKSFIVVIAALAVVAAGGLYVIKNNEALKTHIKTEWNNPSAVQDADVPIREITTGNKKKGITVELKDGVTICFKFTMSDSAIEDLSVTDGSGNPLELTLTDENTQTYTFNDQTYAAENMYFCRDDSHGLPFLAFVKDGRSFLFTDENEKSLYGMQSSSEENSKGDEYYLISTAGRTEKLPQKDTGEVYEIFSNGFWSGRGPIYNRSLPLLKHNIIVGAGADNFIMVYPQRNYIQDDYISYGSNSLNVKPHCYYLQLWIQEGFIAFAAAMVFFFWYVIRSIRLYRKVSRKDSLGILGFAIFVGILGCLIAFLANDMNICTGSIFWTMLGAGWGVNEVIRKKSNKAEDKQKG